MNIEFSIYPQINGKNIREQTRESHLINLSIKYLQTSGKTAGEKKSIAYNRLAVPYEIPPMVSLLLLACNNGMPLVFLRVHPPYRR